MSLFSTSYNQDQDIDEFVRQRLRANLETKKQRDQRLWGLHDQNFNRIRKENPDRDPFVLDQGMQAVKESSAPPQNYATADDLERLGNERIKANEPGYLETAGKGLVRGLQGLGGGAGSIMRWAGEATGLEGVAEHGKLVSDVYRKAQEEGTFARDRGVYRGTFMENPSIKRTVGIIAEALPSLGAALMTGGAGMAMGLSRTAASWLAGSALGLLEGAPQYEEAREAGKDVGEASIVGLASTAGTAILESLAVGRFLRLGKVGKAVKEVAPEAATTAQKIAGKIPGTVGAGKGVLIEGMQESSQELWQNLVAKMGYEPTKDLAEGLVEAFIGGAGAGGIAGGVVAKLNSVAERAQDAGVTDDEIGAAVNDLKGQIDERAKTEILAAVNDDLLSGSMTVGEVEALKGQLPELKSDLNEVLSTNLIAQIQRNLQEAEPVERPVNVPGIPEPTGKSAEESMQAFEDTWGREERVRQSAAHVEDLKNQIREKSEREDILGMEGRTPYLKESLRQLKEGEPGGRIKTVDYDGTEEWTGYGSTYPDWFRDQGWSRDKAIAALEKGLTGKPFSPSERGQGEESIWEAALLAAEEERNKGYIDFAAEIEENPELIGNMSLDEYRIMLGVLEDEKFYTGAVQEAAAAFRQQVESEAFSAVSEELGISEEEFRSVLEDPDRPEVSLDQAWEDLSQEDRDFISQWDREQDIRAKEAGQPRSGGTVETLAEGVPQEPVSPSRIVEEPEPTKDMGPKEKAQVREEGEAGAQVYDYSSTQVNLPEKEAETIRSFSKKIPDSELYVDPEAGYESGREDQPHITVKYGLDTVNPKDVEPLLSDQGPITAKMGKVSIFEGDDNDVVKVDIESPELHALNKKIANNLKVTDTYPTYQPHATIAYVKKGEGKKYVGDKSFEGKEITLDSFVFSGKDGKETVIPLKGEPAKQPLPGAEKKEPEVKPPPEAVEPVPGKKPWEMTREEYSQYGPKLRRVFKRWDDWDYDNIPPKSGTKAREKYDNSRRDMIINELTKEGLTLKDVEKGFTGEYGKDVDHVEHIKKALADGKTISPEVMRDYPDIQQEEKAKPDFVVEPKVKGEEKGAKESSDWKWGDKAIYGTAPVTVEGKVGDGKYHVRYDGGARVTANVESLKRIPKEVEGIPEVTQSTPELTQSTPEKPDLLSELKSVLKTGQTLTPGARMSLQEKGFARPGKGKQDGKLVITAAGVDIFRELKKQAREERQAEKKIVNIGTPEKIDVPALSNHFLEQIKSGVKGLDKVKLKKQVADLLGVESSSLTREKGYSHKPVEEAYEYALVKRGREIIDEGVSDEQIYGRLKELYENQPRLGTRTSGSMLRQAYSTPIHLGYLTQRFAGVTKKTWNYEPTAGIGMLVTAGNPETTRVNELDDTRVKVLQDQGHFVTKLNARAELTRGVKKYMDSVTANPPFGSIPVQRIDGYKISKLEHKVVMNALAAMKDNGKAAFIIGGKHFNSKGQIEGPQQTFLNWLYHNYNVVENIEIPGEEYSRQGAKFPVRLIVVHGRKAEPIGVAPFEDDKEAYTKVNSIDEILPILKEVESGKKSVASEGTAPVRDGAEGPGDTASGGEEGGALGGELHRPVRPEGGKTGEERPGLEEHPGDEPGTEGMVLPDREGTPGGSPGTYEVRRPLEGGEIGTNIIPPGAEEPGTRQGRPGPAGTAIPGESEGVPGGTKEPAPLGVPGTGNNTDAIIDDLLNLSDEIYKEKAAEEGIDLTPEPAEEPQKPQKKKTPRTPPEYMRRPSPRTFKTWFDERVKNQPVKRKRKPPKKPPTPQPEPPPEKTGWNLIKEGISDFNDIFGEVGAVGIGEKIPDDDSRWIKAKAALDKIWQGLKQVYADVQERAKVFVKQIYNQLGARGRPYIDKFIQTTIRKDLEEERKPPAPPKEEETEYQITYHPKSKGNIIDETLIPKKMAQSVQEALDKLEKEVGDIDEYVKNKLKYKSLDSLHNALSADQVDATALAIYNIDRNSGMIIGDQTGVGKGRVAAALYRYANLNDTLPIFFTAKPELFSDFYRDMVDIGYEQFHPLIIASDSRRAAISNEQGMVVQKLLAPRKRTDAYENILNTFPARNADVLKDYNGVVTNYSQVNAPGNRQGAVLSRLFPGAVAILDEAHKASGLESNTGMFIREALTEAHGVTYLSATFAKRPDTMPLYYRTDLSRANLDLENLIEAVEQGGVPLQEILSSDLAKVGQYVRREKSFAGIATDTYVDTQNRERDESRSDGMTSGMREIFRFDEQFGAAFKRELRRARARAKRSGVIEVFGLIIPAGQATPTGQVTTSVNKTNFAATAHNAVRQLLFAMKTDVAVKKAITELSERSHIEKQPDGSYSIVNEDGRVVSQGLTKEQADMSVAPNGRKVMIAVDHTMEAFIEYLKDDAGELEVGAPFDINYGTVLKRNLERCLAVKVKHPAGDEETLFVNPRNLPPNLQALYHQTQDYIDSMVSDLPGSPIDKIKAEITRAGYTVNEITGRTLVADLEDLDNWKLRSRPGEEKSAKKEILKSFNDGEVDVIILNRSGAEGVSAHASPKFKDQRPRTFLGVQPQLNVDDEVQLMGRINRKGQVALPRYLTLFLDIPAEIRPASVLMRKMKSLSANTSANSDSPLAQKTLPDMMNRYGDRITQRWVDNHPDVADDINVTNEDGFVRVSGRIAMQPVTVQREFFEEVEAEYIALIEELKEQGLYDLEVQDLDLKARTVSKDLITAGTDENHPLGTSTYREKVSVINPSKPYKRDKIVELVEKRLDGKTHSELFEPIISEIEEGAEAYISEKRAAAARFGREYNDQLVSDSMMHTRQYIRGNQLGATYSLSAPGLPVMTGVLVDIRRESNVSGNPAALSKTKLVFAVNTALRKITISLSSLSRGDSAVSMIDRDIADDWDNISASPVRSERYMITGNLLQGFADAPDRSRIVRFTMDGGKWREAILTPLSYRPSDQEGGDTVRVTSDLAEKVLRSGNPLVGQTVTITSDGVIIVPASRQRGGPFFLDETLLSYVRNHEFETVSNEMRATIEDGFERPAIDRVYRLGEAFTVDRSVYDLVKDDETPTQYSMAPGAKGTPPQRVTTTDLPDSLSKAFAMGRLSKLRGKKGTAEAQDYRRAKRHGDEDAGDRVVLRMHNERKLDELQKVLEPGKPTLFVPVVNSEANQKLNVLPHRYAKYLEGIFGGLAYSDIVKVSGKPNTDVSLQERISKEIIFDGSLPEGDFQVVIVDDNYTSGKTTMALLGYLQNLGADVKAVTTLAYSARNGAQIKPTEIQLDKIRQYAKMDTESRGKNINDYIREVTGHDINEFTGAEANAVAKRKGQSTFRSLYPQRDVKKGPGKALPPTRAFKESLSQVSTAHARQADPQALEELRKDVFGWLKDVLPRSAIKRITAELTPKISMKGRESTLSEKQWGEIHETSGEIMGSATTDAFRSFIELSYNFDNDTIQKSTYHEGFHVAARWLLPEADYKAVMDHFGGNEEAAADAFSDFAMGKKGRTAQPSWLTKIFRKLRLIFKRIRNGLQDKGFQTHGDVFERLWGKEYDLLPEGQRAARVEGDKEGDARLQAMAGLWYSQMQRFLKLKLPGAGNPKQIAQTLTSWAKKGEFKGEELEWSGVLDWLEGKSGKVKKQEVLDYLAANNVQIEEVTKKGEPSEEDIDVLLNDEVGEGLTREEAREFLEREEDRPKYFNYILPGGKNYRELLLTLPVKGKHKVVRDGSGWTVIDESEDRSAPWLATQSEAEQEAVRLNGKHPKDQYYSGHWDEPNVLAHIRFNERTDADGNRVLFIEEIQSDWHQEGRKKGYRGDATGYLGAFKNEEARSIAEKMLKANKETLTDGTFDNEWRRLAELEPDIDHDAIHDIQDGYGVPDAPFKKTWPLLAFKRMVRYAAENGFDRIAWAPGEVQADRYDLSKQVSQVQWAAGPGILTAFGHNDEKLLTEYTTEDKLADYIGKDVAEKLLTQEPSMGVDPSGSGRNKIYSLEGPELKVGGEGMKGFYDKMLPSVVNKFFGKKGWGKAKVGVTKVSGGGKIQQMKDPEGWQALGPANEFLGHFKTKEEAQNVIGVETWSLPITPEMRQKAMQEGMTQFAIDPAASKAFDKQHTKDSIAIWDIMKRIPGIKMKEGKPDFTSWQRLLSVPSHFFHEVEAMGRVFNDGLENVDNRHMILDNITMAPDEHYYTVEVDTFRRQDKAGYRKLKGYLKKRDQNQIGYSIIEDQDTGQWHLFGIKDKQIPIDSFSSEGKAIDAMIQAEANDYRKAGASEQEVNALMAARRITNNGFQILFQAMRDLRAEYERLGMKLPTETVQIDGKAVQVNLKMALAKMGDMRGYYMPRIRKPGRYVVLAEKKGAHPIRKHFDSKKIAEGWAAYKESQGYKVTLDKQKKMPEDVFEMAGQVVAQEAIINEALQRIRAKDWKLEDFGLRVVDRRLGPGKRDFMVKGPTSKQTNAIFKKMGGRFYASDPGGSRVWHFENPGAHFESRLARAIAFEKAAMEVDTGTRAVFAKALVEQVANVIKARGVRAHMIGRVDAVGLDVWEGYEEDPAIALAKYARGISAGEAKKIMARDMLLHFTGTDISWAEFKRLEGEDVTYEDYLEFVENRRVDPVNQTNAFKEGRSYMEHMLRNEEAIDRLTGSVKGIAVLKYLGGRVSAPLVNLTALVTSVPAAMEGFGKIPIHKSFKYLAKAGKLYGTYKFKDKDSLPPDIRLLFDEIHNRGWHNAQYNREALSVLRGKAGRSWDKAIDWSMVGFGVTEQINRVSTIAGAYLGLKALGQTDHDAMLALAKKISDQAHATYGKANYPLIARGSHPAAQVMKAFYVFKTFSHNYLLTMKDLWGEGWTPEHGKAFSYMALSPAVLAGAGGMVGWEIIMAAVAKAFDLDDPEEDMYAWLEANTNQYMANFARFGAFGLIGMNLKGSLEIGVTDLPTNWKDVLGAPGSVIGDIYEGGKNIFQGDVSKGIEKISPLAVAGPIKAYREATEGLTTRTNAPIFYGRERVKADISDALLRALSFNPAAIAKVREQKWSERRQETKYSDMRVDIYSRIKRFMLQPVEDRNKADWLDIVEDIREYNQRIRRMKLVGIVPFITGTSIKTNIKRSFRPKKSEIRRRAVNE